MESPPKTHRKFHQNRWNRLGGVYQQTHAQKKYIYIKIILIVRLYGCETWSLIIREESRLGVFENRILRRIFGPKRDENEE